ncbi:HlyD family secretion protein [Xylella fastidiosa]|uniref:HlyD family secretion protein n=1 Tax=Xylella fastidiosa TaxID=2371 RepID=UPI0011231777|nr:HlyD family efflux transporter periplasmic adaptor subunit [Xylella fastidiosa]TNV94122.1 hemolysin D [Xylella fastidiosa]
MKDLFRKEVLEAKRTSWLGGISLIQPIKAWLLVFASSVMALLVVVFLCVGTYTRRSSVTGQLVPSKGLVTVVAPATGMVSQIKVSEGANALSGQILALVTVPRTTLASGDAIRALEQQLQERKQGLSMGQQAQAQVLSAQTSGIEAQLSAAQRELAQIEIEIATRQKQIQIANETLQRLKQLEDARYVGTLQIKQQESTVLDYTSQMQAMQRQAIMTRRSIAQLQQSLRELPGQYQNSQATYRRELAQLEQEKVETEARGALSVVSPIDGIVATQIVKSQQTVQAGEPMLSLLPVNGELEAELLLPSSAIGFIEQGDEVRLRYQAYPYQKFGHQRGQVSRISRSALTSSELAALIGNTQQTEPYYRVIVKLPQQSITVYGRHEPLKPGMLIDADILSEKRRLIEWIFEPLYSLRGKVSDN